MKPSQHAEYLQDICIFRLHLDIREAYGRFPLLERGCYVRSFSFRPRFRIWTTFAWALVRGNS